MHWFCATTIHPSPCRTPPFTLHVVGASSRSARKKCKDAVKWKKAAPMAQYVGELVVKESKVSEFLDCDVVFSGLDADDAGEISRHLLARKKIPE